MRMAWVCEYDDVRRFEFVLFVVCCLTAVSMWKNNNKFGVVSFLFVWGNNKPLNRNWSLQQPFRKKSSSRIELKIPILSSVHTNSWMPTLLVLSGMVSL